MDIQALKAFIAVSETQSFSQAAKQLHLTQPAVSKRISSLEQHLDTAVFDRIGKTISLTEAGKALLPRALQIMQDLEDAERAIADLDGSIAGKLSIGISHHIGLHRLPPILREYAKQYPQVELALSFLDSEQAYEDVSQGKIELAIITLAPTDLSTLKTIKLWPDELIFAASKTHPLAAKHTLTLNELTKHRALLPGLNTYTGQIVEQLFRQQGLQLDFSSSSNYLETIRMMVSIGLGWSVLPKTMQSTEVMALNIEGSPISRDLGCIYHNNRSLSNSANAFITLLEQFT